MDSKKISTLVAQMPDRKRKTPLDDVDMVSDYQLDRTLKRYVDRTVDTMQGGLFHSISVDKSRVGTVGLLIGAIANEKNAAAWVVPQVSGECLAESGPDSRCLLSGFPGGDLLVRFPV